MNVELLVKYRRDDDMLILSKIRTRIPRPNQAGLCQSTNTAIHATRGKDRLAVRQIQMEPVLENDRVGDYEQL